MIRRLLTILFFCYIKSTVLYASENKLSYQQHLQKIEKEIKQLDKAQQRAAQIKTNLNQQLRYIDEKISRLSLSLSLINQRIEHKQHRLKVLANERQDLQAQYQKQQLMVAKEFTLQQQLRHSDPLKLVLNQQDPLLVDRTNTYLNVLQKTHLNHLKQLQDLQARLDQNTARNQQTLKQLSQTKTLQLEQITQMNHEKTLQTTLVTTLARQISTQGQQLKQLNDSKQQLEKILNRLRPPSNVLTHYQSPNYIVQKRKSLPWPVNGHILRTSDPIHRHGLTISTNAGQPVKAVFDGKVVFADWLQGYGMMVIIQHDHGFLTLYGNNQRLNTHIGQWIRQGDVIATVGRSGGQTTDALYFEIRQKDQPLSPLGWLSHSTKT